MRNGQENLSLREYSCSQPRSPGYGTLKRLWDKEPGPSPNKAKMVSSGPYFSLLFELPTVYLLLLLVFSVWHGFFQKLSWFPFLKSFSFEKKKKEEKEKVLLTLVSSAPHLSTTAPWGMWPGERASLVRPQLRTGWEGTEAGTWRPEVGAAHTLSPQKQD